MEVLLVEDNPGDARLVREYLGELDGQVINVVHVTHAEDARQRLAASSFDVVLLDLGLPDAQGLDGLRCLRRQAKQVPIVLLTGLEDESVALQALEDGAQDYVTKSRLDAELLSRTIRYAIERKRAQRELERHARDLERANLALRNFMSTASHELQTPLTNLLSATEILLQHGGSDSRETHDEFLTMIEDESHRISQLVGQMLEVTALEGGTQDANFTRLDLGELARTALRTVEPACARASVEVVLTGVERAAVYEGDRDLLERLLVKLLENAIAFSPAGSTVTVTLTREDGAYEIRVADRGPGIPGEDRKREIFQPFVQNESILTDKPAGLGLGLAVARQIAELHGAAISCEDNAGGGALFVVSFPIQVGQAPVHIG